MPISKVQRESTKLKISLGVFQELLNFSKQESQQTAAQIADTSW
jgi:hypothetical protein